MIDEAKTNTFIIKGEKHWNIMINYLISLGYHAPKAFIDTGWDFIARYDDEVVLMHAFPVGEYNYKKKSVGWNLFQYLETYKRKDSKEHKLYPEFYLREFKLKRILNESIK